MRLYLSSIHTGNQPHRLAELCAADKRALVLVNACDAFDPAERPARAAREIQALETLGFQAEELDLRDYFQPVRRGELADRVASSGLVWARGGNAFVLLRAMRQSGFGDLLMGALSRDAIVYGGYSGGIAVLAPSLRGIEIVNDPDAVPEGYDPAVPWDGLGVLPYALAPHYQSAHPSSPGIDLLVRHFQDHAMPYKTLRDGEVLIVSGDGEEWIR